MSEIFHPASLTDDYGNQWVKEQDGTYSTSDRHTRWTLDEVRKVYGVSAEQTPEVVRVEHEHDWITVRRWGELHDRQRCNCGARRILVDEALERP